MNFGVSGIHARLEDRLEKLEDRAGIHSQDTLHLIVDDMLDGSIYMPGVPPIIFKDMKQFNSWCDQQEALGKKIGNVIYDDLSTAEHEESLEDILRARIYLKTGRTRPMTTKEKAYREEQYKKELQK
ncbi:hypothetical protein [Ligilactobacillus acidipiscis]|uniref:hypothetical protein n=1 Tax=Ligilactobacillus acidipiscis TaxID=89059 RepID=UPI0023F8B30F|nr:hypothetical protein [Ligilactobacillus acidipiscis]WEV56684.1 hypothetical protein OZX66_10735 [Ligilactobacillus acidipiscis]